MRPAFAFASLYASTVAIAFYTGVLFQVLGSAQFGLTNQGDQPWRWIGGLYLAAARCMLMPSAAVLNEMGFWSVLVSNTVLVTVALGYVLPRLRERLRRRHEGQEGGG